MTSQNRIELLDADVLIAAHRNYYAPDLCPGFWDCLSHFLISGQLLIIDRVFAEIQHPQDLAAWVRQVTRGLLADTSASDIVQAFTQIVNWVQHNPQFTPVAKNAFAMKADGWLVAHAIVNGTIVVTNERFRPDIRNDVKLPNVCREFGVDYQDTYTLLRDLGASFSWEPPA